MNSNIESIIADVMSEFEEYKSLIDEDSVYQTAILSVKEFGNNATEYFEDVVKLRDGVGDIPENFYKMEATFMCNKQKENQEKKYEIRNLIREDSVVEINNIGKSWNECCYCKTERGYEIKNEKEFSVKKPSSKCYSNFERVKINRFVNKTNCTPKCFEFSDNNSDKEITIDYRRNKIKSNIEEGFIYVLYKGFPVDEGGMLDFNDTANSNFYTYMQYSIRVKIAEMLAIKPEAASVANMLQYYSQNKERYRRKVRTELVSSNYDPNRLRNKMKRANRRYYKRNSIFGR